MHEHHSFRIILLLAANLALDGCFTHAMTKPAPQESKPIAVSYSGEDISTWTDMPEGAYHVPNSQVIISGHQKTGAAAIMFGVVGALVANSIDKSVGKSSVKESQAILHLTLNPEAQQDLTQLLGSDNLSNRFTTQVVLGEPELSISGSIVLTFIDATSVVPFVVLRATLKQHSRNKEIKEPTILWSTRYFCSIGAPKPLSGDNSWASDNGAALQATVSAELKRAMKYMLYDIVSPAPRDDARKIVVSGYYPFIKGKFEIVGYSLGDDDDSVMFSPRIADASVLAGVAIVDKSQVTVRAANKDDKTFKRLADTTQ